MDFHGLNRKKLQELCKKHGIPANLKNVEMADLLSSLLLKEEMPEKAVATKRGRSCLKNVSEDVELVECEKVGVGSKEVKKVRFSPENQTFLFERTDPRVVRLLARKKRAFVNSRKEKDPAVVSGILEESERLGVVSDDVGRVAEPVGKRNLRRRSVVKSEDMGLVGENDENVVKLAVTGGNLGRSLRSRRGEVILETNESVEMVSKEENVVKGKNLRRNSRRSIVQAKDLDLESENVDDGEKLPTKEANLELNLRNRRSKMKQDNVEAILLLSPCPGDNVNKPETVGHVEKLPTKEGNLELNLRSRRCKMKQDNVEVISLLPPCGGVGGDNVNKPVKGRNPKRSLRSRGGIEKENGVGGASLLSPCVEKKAKRGTKGKGIVEKGGGEEVDRPQNEMVNHGGNIGRVTRKQLRNVDVVAVNLERDDDCVAEVSGLNSLKKRGQPRKSARLAEHSPAMILEPLENKGIKRGRRKTLMVKQHDINEGRDVVVEKLGEGNNMDGNGSRESAKKSRKDVKDGSVEELGDIRRSSRQAAKTKVDISVAHQTMHHVERMDHMIEDDSLMPPQLESRNTEVTEQYKATEEINVQLPIIDETTTSLLRNNGDDEANMGHECPGLIVATEEVNVQIPITNVGGGGTRESAKRSRRNDKNGSVEGLDYIRRSGRRAAKNTVDISWSHQPMLHVERIDYMIENDSQMVAQIGSRSPEGNEQYQATEAVNVHMPVNDDSTTALLQNRDDDDEANKAQDCPELVVATDYDSEDKNASLCSMTAQICDAIEANHEEQTSRSSNELESGRVASETLESSLAFEFYDPSNEEKWPEKSSRPSKKDETTYQDVNEKPDVIETAHIASNDVIPGYSTPAGNASDDRNPNTEGQIHENKSSVPKEQKVENLREAQHNPMKLEVCINTETNSQDVGCSSYHSTFSLVHNDFDGAPNQVQKISFPLNGAFDGSFEDEKASVAHDAVEGTIDDTSFSSVATENCVGTSEPICSSAIQPTLLRSRDSVCVHEDTNIVRNCEDFESNGVPELHDFEVNEQRKEEEFEELSSPCKDNEMGSELLEDSAIFVDNLNVQLIEPSKVCGTTGACKSIFVHEPPSSSRTDTNIMRNSEEFESNGVPELHDYEMNEQSREDEGFEDLATPCKDIPIGSELLEASEKIVDKLGVQLTEQSKASGSTGVCNSICASSSRSDTKIMKSSKDFESNGVPVHEYEIIKQSTEDEVFDELSSPCKDNSVGSVLLEGVAIVDKFNVQLTEQSKYSGACNSICPPEKQPSNSPSDIDIMKNSEGFESNGVTELHDYETNEQAVDEGFEELSSPCKDNATGSELLEVSAVIGNKFDVQLTEQSNVSGSTGVSNSIVKEADQTISEISAAEVERREERCNDTSGGKLLCSANVCKTDHFVEFDKTTLEQSEHAKDTQPFILEDDFNNTTEASGFTAASFDSESMQPNIDEHYGATRDNFYVEQKPERFSDVIAFSPSSSEQLRVTHNTVQVGDYSSGESGVKKAHENAEQYVQILANAAAAAVPLYQSPRPCNSKESASLRSSEAQYDNSTSEQQDLADNSKDFEYCLQHLFSEADILNTNEIKGLGSITDDDDDEDLKETRSVSQVTMFKVDSSLRGEVADDIEGPSRDEMDMDDEDLKETHSVSQVTGSKADSSLRKLVANDIEGPSTDDMDVDNNQKSVPPLNEDSETKICSTGKSNTILAASVSMELLKEENIEEATQIPLSTLQLNMAYNMRLSEECEEKESEMNSPTLTNLGGSNPSLIQMTDRCTEVQEEHVPTPPIIVQGTLNDNFESNLGLAKSLENENEIGYNMSGSNVGLSEHEEVGRSRWKSDIIHKECGDGEWPTEFISDEKLEAGGEASVKGRVQSPSAMGESTPKVSPATLWKFMEDAKDVVTVTRSRLQDGVSDGRSKKRKSESDISVQTSSSYPKTSVIGEPTVFSGSMEKDEESCKESKVVDIACSGNSRKVDYLKFIQKSPNEDANNLVFEDDLMTFDNENDLDSDKTSRVAEGDDGHYVFSKDMKLNESPTEDANNLAFEDDLMNFDKERDMEESHKTSRVIEGNDDGHYISSQDKKLNESPNQDANNLVFEDDLMNFDNERDLESDKTSRVTEGSDEEHHVSSQVNKSNVSAKEASQAKKSNESASEDANNLVFEDDLMNFDNERDLESDKTSRVTEGSDEEHHVSSQDNKSNESANEAANNLVFENDLMNFNKERDLESDKTLRVVEGNDGGHYVSSQEKKSDELQFHHCSNSSSADLSSLIMGLMEKDMSEMFQAEESSPFLSHDETDHKLDDHFSNQFSHESDSRPDQDGNIVMSEAEELVAWNSAMQMHHETTSEASFNPTNDGITSQNQLKFSSEKDIHANCVVDVTEINEDDNLAKEGLYPLRDSEKKTGEMEELFEVAQEVKSLPSGNSLREREDSNHLKGCKQVETETYVDTAALDDGSGSKLCAEAGSMMAQQNDLEEQVDYRRDLVQDDSCEISTSQLASKCSEDSESLPHETSGVDDDTCDDKSFKSEACIQFKGEEGAQRVSELDATDDKMMLKRRNRSVLIHGTPRKQLLPTIDMKENMAAPKRMQMVNATATKPGLKRKALGKISK